MVLTYAGAMHLITRTDAPTFDAGDTAVIGYAAPSRGASEVSLWQIELTPGSTSPRHRMNREEIFFALDGDAIADIDGTRQPLAAGDCLILPAGTDFTLHVPGDEPFRALACMPAGAHATRTADGATFLPPWAE
jgi:mannose-6-phosphate isomerase-like protein (cupin superfamily)